MNNMFTSENNFVRHCLMRRKYKNVGVVIVMDAVTNYLFFLAVTLEYTPLFFLFINFFFMAVTGQMFYWCLMGFQEAV